MGSNSTAESADTAKQLSDNNQTTMNVDRLIASLMDDLKANRIELPTLPQVATRISKVVDNPRSRTKDIAQVIGADMALSARLVQVANSPLVRGSHQIEDVQAAITRMGSSMVRNIITSFLVKQLFRTKNKSLQKRMGVIWNHSAHVAAISHILATRFTKFKADEVMLAGLLHDIGKLPILGKAAKMASMQDNEEALDMVLDKLHPALGKAILEAWKFSPDIARVASEHENIGRDSTTLDYTDIVIVANLHSYMGKAGAKHIDWQNIPAMKKMNLDPELSIGVIEEAREEIMEIQKVLAA